MNNSQTILVVGIVILALEGFVLLMEYLGETYTLRERVVFQMAIIGITLITTALMVFFYK